MSGAAQGQRQHQGDQENAYRIVPIEELKAIVLNPFEGVGPGAPADRTGDHHDQGNTKTLGSEHSFASGISSRAAHSTIPHPSRRGSWGFLRARAKAMPRPAMSAARKRRGFANCDSGG